MKIKIFIIFAVLLVFTNHASEATAGIDSVNVVPNQPLDSDSITFNISGTASHTPSLVDHDQFSQDGTLLQLDLYVDKGNFTAFSHWNYSKQLQPLPSATYSLGVREFDYGSGTLIDTHNVDFTVTPEPSTLAIFGFALPFFRAFLRRKI